MGGSRDGSGGRRRSGHRGDDGTVSVRLSRAEAWAELAAAHTASSPRSAPMSPYHLADLVVVIDGRIYLERPRGHQEGRPGPPAIPMFVPRRVR